MKWFIAIVFLSLSGMALSKHKDCFDSPTPEDLTMCHEGCNEYAKKPLEYSCRSKVGLIACKCMGRKIIWFRLKYLSANEAIKMCEGKENCKITFDDD